MKPIILYGNSTLAKQVYYESAQYAPDFAVAAFCVGDDFLHEETSFCGLPLIGENEALQKYPPYKYDMLSCVDAPSKLRNRLAIYDKLKGLGYYLKSYISPLACVSDRVRLGENNIVFAFSHIYIDTCLGHSNTIRSTAIVGHDIIIGNGTNISEGVVVGGFAKIGDSCWLGMNSTINNCLTIANDTLVASGAVIMTNTKQGVSYVGNPARAFFSHKDTGIMLDFKRWGNIKTGELK